MITIDKESHQKLKIVAEKRDATYAQLRALDAEIWEILEVCIITNPDLRKSLKLYRFNDECSQIDEELQPYFQILLLMA